MHADKMVENQLPVYCLYSIYFYINLSTFGLAGIGSVNKRVNVKSFNNKFILLCFYECVLFKVHGGIFVIF